MGYTGTRTRTPETHRCVSTISNGVSPTHSSKRALDGKLPHSSNTGFTLAKLKDYICSKHGETGGKVLSGRLRALVYSSEVSIPVLSTHTVSFCPVLCNLKPFACTLPYTTQICLKFLSLKLSPYHRRGIPITYLQRAYSSVPQAPFLLAFLCMFQRQLAIQIFKKKSLLPLDKGSAMKLTVTAATQTPLTPARAKAPTGRPAKHCFGVFFSGRGWKSNINKEWCRSRQSQV